MQSVTTKGVLVARSPLAASGSARGTSVTTAASGLTSCAPSALTPTAELMPLDKSLM